MAKFMCTHTIPPGKFSSTCFVVLAFVAIMVLVAASPLRAGQVDNPEYKAWASFKVGSSRTLTGKSTGGFKTIEESNQSILEKVENDKVMILTHTSTDGRPSARPDLDKPLPLAARIDAKDMKYVGEESIQVMGKTFKCKVYETPKKTWNAASGGQKSSQTKKWMCDDVPGGLVKVEVYITEPGPSEGLQYKRTETSLLSAYEAK
jgi:uncharacterized protein YfaS (alpha-2-macroglobulin family)